MSIISFQEKQEEREEKFEIQHLRNVDVGPKNRRFNCVRQSHNMQGLTNDISSQNQTTIHAMPPLSGVKMCSEIYPPRLLAQKLSNRASFLIMTKSYDESIVLLTRALKQLERDNSLNKRSASCSCENCNEELYFNMSEKEELCAAKKRNKALCCDEDREINVEECSHTTQVQRDLAACSETQHGFVHRFPLLIPKCCIEEACDIGFTLSWIILYNLALAHHLKAVSMDDPTCECGSRSNKSKMGILKQALRLYELAYQLHVDHIRVPKLHAGTHEKEQDRRMIDSLRFTMIISNNLGEIHREAGNMTKHRMCLQHLLSAIMYMVDKNIVALDSSEMDGFYRNVSPILDSNKCARAA
jgi:hypothetical protein